MTATREELIEQLKALEIRRADLVERTEEQGHGANSQREFRAIKRETRLLNYELAKLRSAGWERDDKVFSCEFRRLARQMMDRDAYDELIQATVQRLRHRHRPAG